MRKALLGALLLLAISWNFGGDYHDGKWLGFSLPLLAIFACRVSEKFGWGLALTLAYFLGSSMWVTSNTLNGYSGVDDQQLVWLRYYSADSAMKLLLVVCPLLLLRAPRLQIRSWGRFLAVSYCLVALGQIFWSWRFYGCQGLNSCGGPLMNPSLNAGMMGVVLPIVAEVLPWFLAWPIVGLVGVAIMIGKSSVGIGIFVAFLGLHVLASRRLWFLIPAAGIVGFALWTLGVKEFVSFGDRDLMWRFFMGKWAVNHKNWAFGTGFGTFRAFSLGLQQIFKMRYQYWWPWLHNDWLEAVFVGGLVGGALQVAVFFEALWRLWKRGDAAEARSLALFGLTMGANYPLHIALPCVYAAWLLWLGLVR